MQFSAILRCMASVRGLELRLRLSLYWDLAQRWASRRKETVSRWRVVSTGLAKLFVGIKVKIGNEATTGAGKVKYSHSIFAVQSLLQLHPPCLLKCISSRI